MLLEQLLVEVLLLKQSLIFHQEFHIRSQLVVVGLEIQQETILFFQLLLLLAVVEAESM
jgi:hypothetical protein